MKPINIAAVIFAGSINMASAQSQLDSVVKQLSGQGYTNIEVKRIGSTVKFEGYRNGSERELIYNAETWQLIKDETNRNRSAESNRSGGSGGGSGDDDSYDDDDDDNHGSGRDHDHDRDHGDDDDDDDDDHDDDEDDDDDDDDDDEDDDDRSGRKGRG